MYSKSLYPEDVKPNRRVMSFVDEFKNMEIDPIYNRPEDGDDVPVPFLGTEGQGIKERLNKYSDLTFDGDRSLTATDSDIFAK